LENRWRVQDLVRPLKQAAERLGLFPGMSDQEREAEAWKWALHEFLALDRRNSLEGLGCLGFSLVRPRHWQPPTPLLAWGLEENEVWTFFEVLLDTIRLNAAILFPEIVSPSDEFFAPRNREYFIRGHGSDATSHVLSWSPSGAAVSNTRLDFLQRLLERLGHEMSRDQCVGILNRIWSSSLNLKDRTSCWHEYFSEYALRGGHVVYRMKPQYWELRPSALDSSIQWYHCSTCHRLTLRNVRGVCPTYRCPGTLRPTDPDQFLEDNHYRRLYTKLKPIELIAREHTAQLTSHAAAELQTEFIEGAVNVLSCSTTFELGVDVGQLETVFMRNVPPSAANYVQRAGRAGRRTGTAAFALTFAQRRPHDLAHFSEPDRMIHGQIHPPYFELANEKIVRRHVYATALAAFWKQDQNKGTFGNVAAFFFDQDGPKLVEEFLTRRPESLRRSLERIVPEPLRDRLGLEDWSWISDGDGMFGDNGVLTRAARLVRGDVAKLEQARQELIQENKPSDHILRVIRTIKDTYLISYLSSHNVIPKYGFPVDVVSLDVSHALRHTDEAKNLELDRDLRIALSEYAPDGQVVAAGKVWTSRYIKRLPDRGWRRYRYAVCRHCECYQRVLAETDERLEQCRVCEQPLEGRMRGEFIIRIRVHDRRQTAGKARRVPAGSNMDHPHVFLRGVRGAEARRAHAGRQNDHRRRSDGRPDGRHQPRWFARLLSVFQLRLCRVGGR